METKTKKKILLSIAKWLLIVVLVTFSFFSGFLVSRCGQTSEQALINEILGFIEDYSVNYNGEPYDEAKSLDGVVKSLLSYDEYAKYYSPEEYSAVLDENSGRLDNFGFAVWDSNKIYKVIGNSPAYYAGLRRGDTVTGIRLYSQKDFTPITDLNSMLAYMNTKLTEPKIVLRVTRDGEFTDKEIEVESKAYTSSYVEYYDNQTKMSFVTKGDNANLVKEFEQDKKMDLPDDTAYIDFIQYEGRADIQFRDALQFMKSRNKSKLILDLSTNGGGSIDIMLKITSLLVKAKGNYTVSIVEEKNSTTIYQANSNNYMDFIENIVVLGSDGTASASETMLGAMLSYGKKEGGNGFSLDNVVLTKNVNHDNYSTYGKAIVQMTSPLSNGGGIRLTIAKTYFPDENKTCIQGVGIVQTNPLNCVENNGMAIARALEILAS